MIQRGIGTLIAVIGWVIYRAGHWLYWTGDALGDFGGRVYRGGE